MRLAQILRILATRRRLRNRETWSRTQLEGYQRRALAALRGFAIAHSPFYAELHRGLANRPLAELPIVSKRLLMARYDDIVTDRAIRLSALRAHLEDLADDELFLGRYSVASTSGSSGLQSIVPSDHAEWAEIIGSYARANEWAGIRLSPFHRARMAVVSSRIPSHQSARVSRTVTMPLLTTLRLDAAEPMATIVGRLNAQRPDVLIAYASMIRALAEEQIGGALRIGPRVVNCSSEVLTREARTRASQAWGVEPFEVYAATETGGIAAECDRHTGMHLFEDLVIAEPVDDDGLPIAPGMTSARLLVTVLFSRTLPLIRYELTDSVRLSTESCSCGRPFRLVEAIEGRSDDVLELPGTSSSRTVRVHPKVFVNALDGLHADAWQVRQEADGLRVMVAKHQGAVDVPALRETLIAELLAVGVPEVRIAIDLVADIPPGASGKRPLVVGRERAARSGS